MAKVPKFIEIPFPINGVSTEAGYSHQDAGPQGTDVTCVSAQNVRGYDPTTNRVRGAQRAGHSKYLTGTLATNATFFEQISVTADDGSFSNDPASNTYDNAAATEVLNYNGSHSIVGFFHFPNITIPNSATILFAYLTFRATSVTQSNDGTTHFLLDYENAANPAAVSSAADGRSRTTVNWGSIGKGALGAGVDFTIPNAGASIGNAVQALVNLGGWASGNAMQFFLRTTIDTTQSTTIVTEDGTHPVGRARLTIVYAGNTGSPIQCLNHVVSPKSNAPSSAGIRTVTGVGVAGGTVKTFARGGAYGTVTNGAAALNGITPYIGSVALLGKLYFSDGINWLYYDPVANAITPMAASAGSLPSDGGGNAPRLIATWRSRLVWSGLVGDPYNIFASRVGAPLDYNYNISPADAQMAWALNVVNSTEAGYVPDVVNSLCAYNDDMLIVFGDHTIAQITGDPAAGGQIDMISHTVGAAFGDSWCRDDVGNVWFLGSRGALYKFHPYTMAGGNTPPQRVSGQRIDEKLMTIDYSANVVRLAWDNRFQTVMIYLSPTAGGAATMFAYDVRNNAFWPDVFGANGLNAMATHLMDGDNVLDRVVLLGGFDGSIRQIDLAASDDDGTAISSNVWLGPIQSDEGRLWLREIRAVLGDNSNNLGIAVSVGPNAEAAFAAGTTRWSDVLVAGKNLAKHPMTKAQAQYIVLSNSTLTTAWQFEQIVCDIIATGRVASRVF